jgi:phage head maturation protease
MSFGFRIMPDGEQWQRTADGMLLRTVTDLELFDVSAVTYPAYPSTEVSARCLEMARRAAEQPKAPLNRLARQIRWYRAQENA